MTVETGPENYVTHGWEMGRQSIERHGEDFKKFSQFGKITLAAATVEAGLPNLDPKNAAFYLGASLALGGLAYYLGKRAEDSLDKVKTFSGDGKFEETIRKVEDEGNVQTLKDIDNPSGA